ncbi:MAG TPA: phage tail protein [Leptolyngbyaceae cyanobacterium M33_DOE_097]|uniref:Phage tail protein n=1 Tax=Oscillatoriales cyanobacterium SpSt-418 TaxID=2282169 RepID=A0A7C3KE07_9CYAN|nr:phage tail protein [Leptolyngbyaceae cyanobacterium M33_DOE_097]
MTNASNAGDRVPHELNYVTSNRFYVEMEKDIKASFSECQGLSVKFKKETFSEGGVNDQQRVLLGPAEFGDVTLKRGATNDLMFLEWLNSWLMPQLIDGNRVQTPHSRRNVNILVFNQAGETMQCWTLIGAVPIAWKAPSLQANSNNGAIEELTLAHEGLKVFRKGGGNVRIHDGTRDAFHSFPSH